MKKSSVLLAMVLAGSLALSASADSVTLNVGSLTASNLSSFGNDTFSGSFRLNTGTTVTTGTYTETRANSGSTVTDTIVYTDATTGATSTDTTATTYNTDESKTVAYTHTDFGATAAFTATIAFPVVTTTTSTPHGTNTRSGASAYGTGTFTAADGTTGTLTAFVTDGVISADLTNATTGLTRVLRLENNDGRRTIETTDTVTPAGVLTTATLTRTAGRHYH